MSVQILIGDCRDVLKQLPENHYHCVVTSPPYWGLRDYGIEPVVWGGDPACEHVWGDKSYVSVGRNDETPEELQRRYEQGHRRSPASKAIEQPTKASAGQFCQRCGAWLGCLGLEPTPDLYVAHLVDIFREVRRVLRDDAVLWLNLGDCYAGSWGNYGARKGQQRSRIAERWHRPAYEDEREGWDGLPPTANVPGLKPKDLVGIPWMTAFALRADGWWLRSDVIWHKPNGMPESVRDRPTSAHEHVFLLTKSQRYFYDQDAIREPNSQSSIDRQIYRENVKKNGKWLDGIDERNDSEFTAASIGPINPAGRNKRDVWTIPTHPFPDSHFATFPPALVEICLKAGTSPHGCCPECGAPWERVTEIKSHFTKREGHPARYGDTPTRSAKGFSMPSIPPPDISLLGFRPTCDHDAAPVACRALDPFGGAGTTGLVADGLGLEATLIEIKAEYAEMARERAPMFASVEVGA